MMSDTQNLPAAPYRRRGPVLAKYFAEGGLKEHEHIGAIQVPDNSWVLISQLNMIDVVSDEEFRERYALLDDGIYYDRTDQPHQVSVVDGVTHIDGDPVRAISYRECISRVMPYRCDDRGRPIVRVSQMLSPQIEAIWNQAKHHHRPADLTNEHCALGAHTLHIQALRDILHADPDLSQAARQDCLYYDIAKKGVKDQLNEAMTSARPNDAVTEILQAATSGLEGSTPRSEFDANEFIDTLKVEMRLRNGEDIPDLMSPQFMSIQNMLDAMRGSAMADVMTEMFKTYTGSSDLSNVVMTPLSDANTVKHWLDANAEPEATPENEVLLETMPDYKPEVELYRAGPAMMLFVQDPFGAYLYAWEEEVAPRPAP